MSSDKKFEEGDEKGALPNYPRRTFVTRMAVGSAGLAIGAPHLLRAADAIAKTNPTTVGKNFLEVSFTVNGKAETLNAVDPRMTLLDALREKLMMTGSKKGCDHGQCGACTVLVNGRRINSCLTLAVMCNGAEITSVEGLANGNQLHPLQTAFIKHDAFQCGYCTPGQLCSAVGLMKEREAKTDADIRELMSGNICRCGAYQNILNAIREVALPKTSV